MPLSLRINPNVASILQPKQIKAYSNIASKSGLVEATNAYKNEAVDPAMKQIRKAFKMIPQQTLPMLLSHLSTSPDRAIMLNSPSTNPTIDEILKCWKGKEDQLILTVVNLAKQKNLLDVVHWYAQLLYIGVGPNIIPRDTDHSLKLLSDLASKKHALSQYSLGKILVRIPGKGAQGIKLLELAAEGNVINAWIELGRIYRDGNIVPKNVAIALKYLKLAAEKDVAEADYIIGDIFANIHSDEATAFEHFKKAAIKGLAMAQFNVGLYYLEGKAGLSPNPIIATEYWKMAAEQGHPFACVNLASLYMDGKVVERNLLQAKHLLEKVTLSAIQDTKQEMLSTIQRLEEQSVAIQQKKWDPGCIIS